MPLTVWLGAACVGTAIPLLWWSLQGSPQRTSRAAQANLVAGRSGPTTYRAAVLERPSTERLLDPILHRLAGLGLRFLPSNWFARIDGRLAKAGLLGRYKTEQVVGAKILLVLVGIFWFGLAALQETTAMNVLIAVAAVGIGWFIPDLLLASRGDRRVLAINRELPDVLDQLTVSVEAGLGFEGAMARIARKNRGYLAEEFGRTIQDIQFGVPRVDALEDMSERTQSDDVRHFVLALRQAERMGVPLARTLRIQAGEMRVKRRLRAEEAAYKLPVKLIFPLGFCIFPALFIVILGPAFIQIKRIF